MGKHTFLTNVREVSILHVIQELQLTLTISQNLVVSLQFKLVVLEQSEEEVLVVGPSCKFRKFPA